MRLRIYFLEKFVLVAVFYLKLFATKCQADDIIGYPWDNNNHFFQHHGFKNSDFGSTLENKGGIPHWVPFVLAPAAFVVVVILICICHAICHKPEPRGQLNAVIVPIPTNTSPFSDPGGHSTLAGNNHPTVVNLTFPEGLRHTLMGTQVEDAPPAYSVAISQTSSCSQPVYPGVNETKYYESPPPAYFSISPPL